MKAIHMISSLSSGDAMGNYIRELQKLFAAQPGVDSEIYAQCRDDRSLHHCQLIGPGVFDDQQIDLLTYQFGTSAPALVELMQQTPAKKKVLFYHNVTPAHFFAGYDEAHVQIQEQARRELDQLRDVVDLSIAMSEYSASELRERGFQNVEVVSYMTNFRRYDDLDETLDEQLQSLSVPKILFMGRVVPHKGHMDLLKTFAAYTRVLGKHAKLFIVGGCPFPEYWKELQDMVETLGIQDYVELTGRVSDAALNTYLHHADAFVSMSEHEGFFVPLVECMHLQIPIIAYAAAAVPETLGNGGVLFLQKDPLKAALLIDEVLTRPELLHQIRVGQEEQLRRFEYGSLGKQILELCLEQSVESVVKAL